MGSNSKSDPIFMSAFYYKLVHGKPIACAWEEACALLLNPESRLMKINHLVNGFTVRTSFNVIDIDPMRGGEPRLWSTLVDSPSGVSRVFGRYRTQEEAQLGHDTNVSFLQLCGEIFD